MAMQQPVNNEFSGQFSSEASQWIGNTFNAGEISISAPHQVHNTIYGNNRIGGNAQAHFGDQYNGLTISQYAHTALLPVANFTERTRLHQQIQQQLHDRINHTELKTQWLIVYGIGGAGKTQLVLNYVQQHREDYSAIFWVEARSKESIERDYIQIYYLLYDIHPGASQTATRLEDVVPAVKRWFYRRNKRWLFVFDSADSIDDEQDASYINLRYFLPDDPAVHVIITTQSGAAKKISELSSVEVGSMEKDEAVVLFKKHAEMYYVSSEDEAEISAIVAELGYLALAIILAGSYVSMSPSLKANIRQYLPEYHNCHTELFNQQPERLIDQYGASILTTWESAFQAMRNRCPEACHLLTLLSFLNGDDICIHFELLVTILGDFKFSNSKILTRNDFLRFYKMLRTYSFVSYSEEQQSYTMHKLVQVWAFDRLTRGDQEIYGYAIVALLDRCIRDWIVEIPSTRGRLVPHLAVSCSQLKTCIPFVTLKDDNVLKYFEHAASYLSSCGHWNDARNMRMFILAQYRLRYGDEHSYTISAMQKAAHMLYKTGEQQAALSMQQEVLSKQKQIHGLKHPQTISAMHSIGAYLSDFGDLQGALSIQREVLSLQTQILGLEHPGTLRVICNLSITLKRFGKHREALLLQQELVSKHKQIYGEEHPDTISIMANTANTLQVFGKLKEALSMQREVVMKLQKILGLEHPDTISTMSNLAFTLIRVGQPDEALSLHQRVLAKRKQILGEEHPDTIEAISNLALCLVKAGQEQEALHVQQEFLNKCTRNFGETHPKTKKAQEYLRKIVDLINTKEARDNDYRSPVANESNQGKLTGRSNIEDAE